MRWGPQGGVARAQGGKTPPPPPPPPPPRIQSSGVRPSWPRASRVRVGRVGGGSVEGLLDQRRRRHRRGMSPTADGLCRPPPPSTSPLSHPLLPCPLLPAFPSPPLLLHHAALHSRHTRVDVPCPAIHHRSSSPSSPSSSCTPPMPPLRRHKAANHHNINNPAIY